MTGGPAVAPSHSPLPGRTIPRKKMTREELEKAARAALGEIVPIQAQRRAGGKRRG